MRRRWLAPLLSLTACALVLACGLRAAGPVREPDEAAWIFSSYAYRLAFLRGDLSSPEWRSPDCVDHPPLAKFLIGAFLAPAGLVPSSWGEKEEWFARSLLPYDRAAFMAWLNAAVPARSLLLGRAANSVCVLAACALTAGIGAFAFSAETGALAALLLAAAGLTRGLAAQALSDGLFVALLLASALAQMAWAERLSRERRFSPAWSALCGALAGALFDVKLSGAAELPLLAGVVALTAAAGPAARLRRAAFLSGATAAAAAVAAAVALNPSLYGEPWDFARRMLHHRREILAAQRVVFFGGEFQNARDLACGFLRGLFATDRPAATAASAATALLACAGLAGLRSRFGFGRPAASALALHAAAWTGLTLWTFRLDWPRYLLPVLPFVCLLAALGAEDLRRRRAGLPRRVLLCAAGAALAALPARFFTPLRYWVAHPAEYQSKLDAQETFLLARYPSESAMIRRGVAEARGLLDRL